MKHLKNFLNQNNIHEGLKLGSSKIKINNYSVRPKTLEELQDILKERIAKDKDADLNDIDISEIDDLKFCFFTLHPGNIKVDKWDISNVKNMYYMFYECDKFNGDLSSWDVS